MEPTKSVEVAASAIDGGIDTNELVRQTQQLVSDLPSALFWLGAFWWNDTSDMFCIHNSSYHTRWMTIAPWFPCAASVACTPVLWCCCCSQSVLAPSMPTG